MPPTDKPISEADAILREALLKIRLLIEKAVATQDYTSLAPLATIAEGLVSLRHSGIVEAPALGELDDSVDTESNTIQQNSSPLSPPPTIKRRSAIKAVYPRFERQGDRLVKVGWSKRDGAEYEHKASRNVVDAVVLALSSMTKKLFTIEEMLPLRDAAGAEIPSYQAYMVIAWLRQLKAVERRGNEGYAVSREKLKSGIVEREWKSLTSGEATENVG